MKVCSKCKLELGDSCFHKRNRGGLDCYCKLCKKEYAKQYHQSHKEARLAQSKRYYIDNKVIINVNFALISLINEDKQRTSLLGNDMDAGQDRP